MPEIEKLTLEDALDYSPQTRSLLGVFEEDASKLRSYTKTLHGFCQRLLTAQQEIVAATQSLSQHLKAYEKQNFPLESDGSILASTLTQFSSYLDELSSLHQILATQMSDSVMYPIGKFLQADLDEVNNMNEMMKLAHSEHEAAITRYSKLPKKKDNEKLRNDTNDDLYAMRRKFHQTALHYFSSLNALQYKRKCSLLEPMIGYMQAQKAFYEMGKDAVVKEEIDDFLSNINSSVQSVHQELGQETQKTVERMDSIERASEHLYRPEPTPESPQVPANMSLGQKGGYLFLRSKQMLSTKWERCFFFTQAGNLMCQREDEIVGSLILDLNEQGTYTEPTDIDDRRYLFQIVSPKTKKNVILQAESDRDRDEWLYTLNNIIQDSGYTKDRPSSQTTTEAIAIPSVKEPPKEMTTSMPPPPTPPSTPADGGFIPDAPIQFDMISPSEEVRPFQPEPGKEGPQSEDTAANTHTYDVRFLGSMEVRNDKGDMLISETMRQILAARALHNIFKMTESRFIVSTRAVTLLDPASQVIRAEFSLGEISFWSTHQENKRLFGMIVRTRSAGSKANFTCHVFECNTSGEEICNALTASSNAAFEAIMEKKATEKRKSEN